MFSERGFFLSGLTVATVLFGVARSLLVFYVLVHSSQTLHNRMFESILRAPVLFFDRNPVGKSDTQFLSQSPLFVSVPVSAFENGGEAWEKWLYVLIPFVQKAPLTVCSYQTKSNYGGHTSFYSGVCVCGK